MLSSTRFYATRKKPDSSNTNFDDIINSLNKIIFNQNAYEGANSSSAFSTMGRLLLISQNIKSLIQTKEIIFTEESIKELNYLITHILDATWNAGCLLDDLLAKIKKNHDSTIIKKFPLKLFNLTGETLEEISKIINNLLAFKIIFPDTLKNLTLTLKKFEEIHFIGCMHNQKLLYVDNGLRLIRRHAQLLGLSLAQSWMEVNQNQENIYSNQSREMYILSSLILESGSYDDIRQLEGYLALFASLPTPLLNNPAASDDLKRSHAREFNDSFARLKLFQPKGGWLEEQQKVDKLMLENNLIAPNSP